MSAMMFSFNLYPLRVWLSSCSREAHLGSSSLFNANFRFVAHVVWALITLYELQHEGIYTVFNCTIPRSASLLKFFPRSGISGGKMWEAVAPPGEGD